MRRGYEPVQTWAIMMKDRGSEVIVDFWKPARPIDALLKSSLDGSAAVKMDLDIARAKGYPVNLPKWAGDKDCQKCDKNCDKKATGDPDRHSRKYTKSQDARQAIDVVGATQLADKRPQ